LPPITAKPHGDAHATAVIGLQAHGNAGDALVDMLGEMGGIVIAGIAVGGKRGRGCQQGRDDAGGAQHPMLSASHHHSPSNAKTSNAKPFNAKPFNAKPFNA
jgi:hypothetical protein